MKTSEQKYVVLCFPDLMPFYLLLAFVIQVLRCASEVVPASETPGMGRRGTDPSLVGVTALCQGQLTALYVNQQISGPGKPWVLHCPVAQGLTSDEVSASLNPVCL